MNSEPPYSDPAETCARWPGYCRCRDCRHWWNTEGRPTVAAPIGEEPG